MEQDGRVIFFDKPGRLLHRLHRTHLIIHIHDGYKDSLRTEGLFQRIEFYPAF